MPDNENPYKPTTAAHATNDEHELKPPPMNAQQAVRNACRYAIPVMSIAWLLLSVEFYFSNSHRMNDLAAAILACFQSLTFVGMFLGIWLGCAAIVGATRQ